MARRSAMYRRLACPVVAILLVTGCSRLRRDNGSAEARLSQRITANPRDVSALLARGDDRAKRKVYDLAVSDYTQAIRVDAKNVSALWKRGHTRLEMGDHLPA